MTQTEFWPQQLQCRAIDEILQPMTIESFPLIEHQVIIDSDIN
jgi:hypothetical protein